MCADSAATYLCTRIPNRGYKPTHGRSDGINLPVWVIRDVLPLEGTKCPVN